MTAGGKRPGAGRPIGTTHNRMLLWRSAEHWLENWQDPQNARIYADSCPLCEQYLFQKNECWGCPIFAVTGVPICGNTPHADVADLLEEEYPENWSPDQEENIKDAIEAEYRFLVTLALGEEVP